MVTILHDDWSLRLIRQKIDLTRLLHLAGLLAGAILKTIIKPNVQLVKYP